MKTVTIGATTSISIGPISRSQEREGGDRGEEYGRLAERRRRDQCAEPDPFILGPVTEAGVGH
ncbi:hypothetical protein [Acrocarpospora catenulata]|uniref:hypothetical protein n=1 Tax=Acrocarpospora catenulata TaxID=2836182 RepID=UPI001BD99972|nr:hypothetical protein [Acrocarpospora catenulata]